MSSKQALPIFQLDPLAKVPGMEYRLRCDGVVEYRYMVEEGDTDYPGFTGEWRVMSAEERRQTIIMGGPVAEWLRSLEER